MDAPTADELRLARRVKLGVRLLVYPLLLGLLAFALHARFASADGDAGDRPWRGTTPQGLRASILIDGDVAEGAVLPVRLRCDDGKTRPFTWTPSNDLYVSVGDHVTAHRASAVRSWSAGWTERYTGDLDLTVGHGAAHGTVIVTEEFLGRAATVSCTSGYVPLALHA